MSNFILTPQYDLFVRAKQVFVREVLLSLPREKPAMLFSDQVTDALSLFANTFSYHESAYGNSAHVCAMSPAEREKFSNDYAQEIIRRAKCSLSWTNQQSTLFHRFLDALQTRIVEESRNAQGDAITVGSGSDISKMWRALMAASIELLGIVGNLRYIVPVSPSNWDTFHEEQLSGIEKAEALYDLYKEGFVWPESPITFVPHSPINNSAKRLVAISPGRLSVLDGGYEITRTELVCSILRELYGHLVIDDVKLDVNPRVFDAIDDATVQQFGTLGALPRNHLLTVMRDLAHDMRCTDKGRDYGMANKVTYVTAVEFMVAAREAGFWGQRSESNPTTRLAEHIIAPNGDFFYHLNRDFPPFN